LLCRSILLFGYSEDTRYDDELCFGGAKGGYENGAEGGKRSGTPGVALNYRHLALAQVVLSNSMRTPYDVSYRPIALC